MSCNLEQDFWNVLASGDLVKIFEDDRVQKLFVSSVDGITAAKILKHLTKAIVEGQNDDLQCDHNVLSTSKFLLENIHSQSSNTDVSVLSCIYYISKYFLKKGKVQMALDLKFYLMNFKVELAQDVMKVYYGLFYELHTFLNQQDATLSCDMKLMIRYESLEILSSCRGNYLHIMLSEADGFVSGEGVNRNRSVRLQYAIKTMNIIKEILKECIVKENCEIVCKYYAQFVSNILINVLNEAGSSNLESLFDVICTFQTSNDKCNRMVLFFVNTLKGMVNSPLHLTSIQEQTSALQHMIENESSSFLFALCTRFAIVYFSIQGHWLAVLTTPLSPKALLVVSKLAILLSVFLKKNIISQHSFVEPSSTVIASFKVIVNLLTLGINFTLTYTKDASTENTVDDCEVFKMLITVQTLCYELLTMLQDNDESLWRDLWRVLAIRSVKLASILGYKECYKHASEVYQNFCCGFLEMEPVIEGQTCYIASEVSIQKAFKGLTQCLIHQFKYKEALIHMGIAVLLLLDDTRELQKLWVLAKLDGKDINLQNYTMCSVFKESKPYIQTTYLTLSKKIFEKINSKTLCRLLFWEAESYMRNRSEMSESICAVGKDLMENCCNTIMFGEGIELVLSSIWMKYDVLKSEFSVMYRRSVEVLMELIEKEPKDHMWLLYSSLGNMHYYYFFAEVTVLRKRLQDDVNDMKDKFPTKEELNAAKGFIDPSEADMKSNIITAYSDLNVQKEHELLDTLQKAVDMWSNVCVSGVKITQSFQNKFDTLLTNIKTAACTFAVYGYYIISLKAWLLYYQLSKSSENVAAALYALSRLLEFSCNTKDNDLWKEASKIGDLLQSNDLNNKEKEILFAFFLAKSNSCLTNNQCEVGWQYLQKLNELSIPGTFGGLLAFVRKYILLSKYYLSSPDPSKIPDDFKNSNSLLSMGQALGILKKLYQSRTIDCLFDNCSLHLSMMEASEWMGNLCLGIKLYRDGYSQLKSHLTLAQTLGLASRCSQIVSKLAQFDLLCHEVESAEVKMLGMETLLGLKNVPFSSFNGIEIHFPEEKTKENNDSLSLDDDIVGMKLLDVPTPARQNVTVSPDWKRSPFRMPSVVKHKERCTCYYCNSFLLQNSVMEVTFIKAQLYVLKGENDLALSFFKGGMKVGDRMKKLQEQVLVDLSKTVHKNNCFNSYFSLSDSFLVNFSKLSMYYTEFLYLSSCYTQNMLQEMITSSQNMLHNAQEYDLHVALEMIDKAQVLYSETRNKPAIHETYKKNLAKEFSIEECPGSQPPEILKTPACCKTKAVEAPVLHRNEDHVYLSKRISPSLVSNLDEKIISMKAKNTSLKSVTRGRRKVTKSVYFDISSIDDLQESHKTEKEEEQMVAIQSTSKSATTNSDLVLSPNVFNTIKEVNIFEKDVDAVTSGIEGIIVSPFSNGSVGKSLRTYQRGAKNCFSSKSYTGIDLVQQEKETCHTTQEFKSGLGNTTGNECYEQAEETGKVSEQNIKTRKDHKFITLATADDCSIVEVEGQSMIQKSCKTKKTSKLKDVLFVKGKFTKQKPKLLVYSDSSDSNLASPDAEIECNERLKQTKMRQDEHEVSEREGKLPRNQRIPRSICVKEPTSLDDLRTRDNNPHRHRNVSKAAKSACSNIPLVITLDSSDNESSMKDKCVIKTIKNPVSIDAVDSLPTMPTNSNGNQIVDAPERKTMGRRRKNAILSEDVNDNATPAGVQSEKRITRQTPATNRATRSRRKNPFILD